MWEEKRIPLDFDPRLGDAIGRPLRFSGIVRLLVRLGNHTFRVPFLVAERLAVGVLLGTAFHNTHIQNIKCIEQMIDFPNGETIPILEHNSPSGAVATSEEGAPTPDSRSNSGE